MHNASVAVHKQCLSTSNGIHSLLESNSFVVFYSFYIFFVFVYIYVCVCVCSVFCDCSMDPCGLITNKMTINDE